GIEAMPLLFTSDASWAESNLQEGPDWKFDPGSDRKGPLVLGVALSQDVQETSESSSASTENSEKVDSSSSENQASEKNEEEKETTTQNSEENSEETVDGNIDSQSSQTPEETKPEETTDSAEDPKDPKKQSRLVVIGDSDFASNTLFQNYLNGDMFLNSIDWLSQEDDTVLSIRPKEPNNRTLKVTPKQARVLVTLALTVPVMAFAASGLLWWSRR
ncbi:MAG: hypothetical protein WBF52_13075, partial [Geitlerinemataceae cyanobacterium]